MKNPPRVRDGDLLYNGKPVNILGEISESEISDCFDCGEHLDALVIMHNNSSVVAIAACGNHPEKAWSHTYWKAFRGGDMCRERLDERFTNYLYAGNQYQLTAEFKQVMNVFDTKTFFNTTEKAE